MLSSLLAGKVISIHAPSRERQTLYKRDLQLFIFQSTLPRGSDSSRSYRPFRSGNFNPRSLAGATSLSDILETSVDEFQSTLPRGSDLAINELISIMIYISIHAPSRERHEADFINCVIWDFNPRSLAGATLKPLTGLKNIIQDFNPRSLAGATRCFYTSIRT